MHLQVQQQERYLHYRPVLLMLAVLVGISIIREWWLVGLMGLQIYCLMLYYLGLQTSAERQHAKEVAEEVTELHLRTIEGLASAINAKDNTTHEHLARVVVHAEAIGKEMGLQEGELKALRTAALLHDIGKLAVPEYIISKPGRLTQEEFEKTPPQARTETPKAVAGEPGARQAATSWPPRISARYSGLS